MTPYPLQFSVDYPDRELDRMSSFLRIFFFIPIAILLGTVDGATWTVYGNGKQYSVVAAGGILVAGPLLMILFRQKYPRWWFDWNLQLMRFSSRVVAYLLLMDDRYPSTDDEQSVHLDIVYPDAERDLNRWMPLVKWFLAIPHYIILFFLYIGSFFVAIATWLAVVFTGRYPEGLFRYQEGVLRWSSRVVAYMAILVTDTYPPFSLSA